MKHIAVTRLVLTAGACSLLIAAGAGCGSDKPTTVLTPISFENRAGLALPDRPANATTPTIKRATATRLATTNAPAIGVSLGEYQTIGGVVSEVNGNPIYANKVLKMVKAELAARAREMDEKRFRAFATAEINKKIQGLQRDELVFGAADRSLGGDDRKLADFLTMQYRTQKITEAGGSVELAQRKAQANGDSFDEDVYDHYRQYMTEVFYRRKVLPRIQVSADDLRNYYTANFTKEFTEQDEVKFRLIKIEKIDGRRPLNKQALRKRADEVLEKAKAGDFAEVARTMNDDARLARSGGEELPIQRGAYRLENVEKAVWETPVGQVTPVIEDAGGLYIAKVESRKDGKTRPFEDKATQERIQRILSSRQFQSLTDAIEQKLRQESMVRESPEMRQVAVEMAMQNYSRWSRGDTVK